MTYKTNVDAIVSALETQLKTINDFSNRVYKYSYDKLQGYPSCLISLQRDRVTPAAAFQWHELLFNLIVIHGRQTSKSVDDLVSVVGKVCDLLDTLKTNSPTWATCLIEGEILFGFAKYQNKTFLVAVIPIRVKKKW